MPDSSTGAFYRVTADHALTFDFPSRDMAEAFAADYGPGCQISREPCSLEQQRDIEANFSPAAILDDLASAIALPVIEAAATDDASSPDVQTVWIITHESETIFTNPDSYVCQMVRDRIGYGVVSQVELQPGETVDVPDHWTQQLRELLAPVPVKRRPVATLPNKPRTVAGTPVKEVASKLDATTEPPVTVFRFDERWLVEECPDGPDDDAFTDDPDDNDPSPQEIAEACRQIRREWDAKTYRSRAGQLPVTRIARSRFLIGGAR